MSEGMALNKDQDGELFVEVKQALDLFNQQSFAECIDLCNELKEKYPDAAEPYFVLGISAVHFGDPGAAIDLVKQAHDRDPDCRDYVDVLANLLTTVGKLAEGLYFAKLSVASMPHRWFRPFAPPSLSNYFHAAANATVPSYHVEAMRSYNVRDFKRAATMAERALRLDSGNMDAWRILALGSLRMGDGARAVTAVEEFIKRTAAPRPADVSLLARALAAAGRHGDALACVDGALELGADLANGLCWLAEALDHQPSVERDRRMAAIGERLPALKPAPPVVSTGEPEDSLRPVRIAYFGGQLFAGADLPFVEAILKHHNRRRFDVTVYQTFVLGDVASTRAKQYAQRWTEVYNLDDATTAMVVKNDAHDVVVDLSGYGEDGRIGVLARRVAPVQLALPMTNATRSSSVDHLLADPVSAKPLAASLRDGQTLCEIEIPCLAVEAPEYLGEPEPGDGPVRFGALYSPDTVGEAVAKAWADILAAVPGSRLVLGCASADAPLVERISETFGPLGVLDRITPMALDGASATAPLAKSIDLLLDPFPVGGGFLLCEALWLGVPVVSATLADRARGWQSAAILAAAGRSEWHVAADAYVGTAVALAKSDLRTLRAELRAAMPGSPLFSPKVLVRRLEQAYLDMFSKRGAR